MKLVPLGLNTLQNYIVIIYNHGVYLVDLDSFIR